MNDLFCAFNKLTNAKTSDDFDAIPIRTNRKDFLAKNNDGAPVFLLHDSSIAKYNPGINLRHLSVQYQTTCSIRTNNIDLVDQFCLISCDPASPDLYELFINCVGAAVEGLPVNAGTKELEMIISKLKDLFRSLAQPTSREVTGLWAELFVILNSSNPSTALSMWHEDKFERFDFSSISTRLEVKSTISRVRAHEFGIEQLQPPKDGAGYVVSLLLQPITGGDGVLDLAKKIEVAINKSPQLKVKLWANIAQALGSDFSKKIDKCFDVTYATKNLAIYTMENIPKPENPLDTRVTSLRFVSDLSSVPSQSSLGITEII